MSYGNSNSGDQFNPYQAKPEPGGNFGTPPPSSNGAMATQMTIIGWTMIVLSSLWMVYVIVNIVFSLSTGYGAEPPPGGTKEQAVGYAVGRMLGMFGPIFFQIGAFAGGVAFIKKQGYPLAWVGTICCMIPLCGPCCGLSIPVGIWAIVLLFQPNVRQLMQ